MEKLVLRKFTIAKETISNLSDGAQRRILGGYGGYEELTMVLKTFCDERLSLGKDTQCDLNPVCRHTYELMASCYPNCDDSSIDLQSGCNYCPTW